MENNNTFPLITGTLQDEIIRGAKKYNEEQAYNICLKHTEEIVKEDPLIGNNLAADIIENFGQRTKCEIIEIYPSKNPARLYFHIKLNSAVSFMYEGKKFIVGPDLYFDCHDSTAFFAGSKVFGRYSIKNDLLDILNENLMGEDWDVIIVPGAPVHNYDHKLWGLCIYAIIDVSAEWLDKKSSEYYECYPFAGLATINQVEGTIHGATIVD